MKRAALCETLGYSLKASKRPARMRFSVSMGSSSKNGDRPLSLRGGKGWRRLGDTGRRAPETPYPPTSAQGLEPPVQLGRVCTATATPSPPPAWCPPWHPSLDEADNSSGCSWPRPLLLHDVGEDTNAPDVCCGAHRVALHHLRRCRQGSRAVICTGEPGPSTRRIPSTLSTPSTRSIPSTPSLHPPALHPDTPIP